MTAFPSLVNPFGMTRRLRVDVSQNMLGDQTIQRIWWNRHIQHAWQIPWPALIDADRDTLLAFFAACRGKILNDISFTDFFDSVSYTCRLDQDSLLLLESPQPHWSGTLTLIETSGWKAIPAPVATFPATVPFRPLGISRLYNTIVQSHQDNTDLRYENFSTPIHRWQVGSDALTAAQAASLIACWAGNGGPYKAFSFTDPIDSTVYDAHFLETELVQTLPTLGISQIYLTVEELI